MFYGCVRAVPSSQSEGVPSANKKYIRARRAERKKQVSEQTGIKMRGVHEPYAGVRAGTVHVRARVQSQANRWYKYGAGTGTF